MAEQFGVSAVGGAVTPCPLLVPTHWLELEVIGADNQPIPWLAYQVMLPDGTMLNGFLDGDGYARFDGLRATGACKVCFPELDKDNWSFVRSQPARSPAAPK